MPGEHRAIRDTAAHHSQVVCPLPQLLEPRPKAPPRYPRAELGLPGGLTSAGLCRPGLSATLFKHFETRPVCQSRQRSVHALPRPPGLKTKKSLPLSLSPRPGSPGAQAPYQDGLEGNPPTNLRRGDTAKTLNITKRQGCCVSEPCINNHPPLGATVVTTLIKKVLW